MGFISGSYAGELSEVRRGARWRRRRSALLFVDYRELGRLAGRLKLAGPRLTPQLEIEAELDRAGLPHGGPIQALCARGLTVYLCHRPDGRLAAVRYEIGSRTWMVPADGDVARLHARGADSLAYTARVRRTAETAQLAVDATDPANGLALAVSFIGRRRRLPLWWAPLASGKALAAGLTAALDAWSAAEPAKDQRLAA
jgi:hypothetical protein